MKFKKKIVIGEMRVSDQLGLWQSCFPEWLEGQNALQYTPPLSIMQVASKAHQEGTSSWWW